MHITLHDQNSPAFILLETSSHLLIQTDQKVISYQNILSIDRLTSRSQQITQKQFVDLIKQKQIKKNQVVKKHKIWAIYGIIVVQEHPYFVYVNQAKRVTPNNRQNHIFQILDVDFINFEYHEQQTPLNQNTTKIINFIKNDLIKQKFYFSYTEDLTVCFRKRIIKTPNLTSDTKFFWNQKNTQFLRINGLNKPWIIPIIQGYISCISQNNLQYRIICRRSKHMSGTRYNCRGINLQGYSSNFAQIQQLIEYRNFIFSHISLRGSVPIFWKQSNGVSDIQFPHKQDQDYKCLKKHYDDLVSDYQCAINTINLLSENKLSQKLLSQRFKKILQKHGKNFYYEFDFNKQFESIQGQINEFIKKYQDKQSLNNFQFYDFVKDTKISQQYFISRINCLDCVDRTNVICCRLGQCFINKVMKIISNFTSTITDYSLHERFLQKYLQNWATLGNRISQLYCGTSSVSQHLTLKQDSSYWSSLKSSIRSLNRFINASQTDSWKQQCNLYLLNQHQQSVTGYFVDNISKYYLKESQFCNYLDINATIITWNVGSISTKEITQNDKLKIAERIFGANNEKSAPQIIFITLQQIVQLVPYNVITNDNQSAKQQWQNIFFQILTHYLNPHKNKGFTYRLYFSQALVGIGSYLYVKNSLSLNIDILNRITKNFSYIVKRGYGGNFGNKGSIISSFKIFDTVIVNFASHFAAGDEKSKERLQDIKAVLQSVNQNKKHNKIYKNADYVFFTGDLNLRIKSSDQKVRSLINQSKELQSLNKIIKRPQQKPFNQPILYNQRSQYRTILNNKLQKQYIPYNNPNDKSYSHQQLIQSNSSNSQIKKHLKNLIEEDELNSVYQNYGQFKKFKQSSISFYPTYRYVKNSPQYDTKRKPAWCDRVLYHFRDKKQPNNLNHSRCVNYSSIDQITASDHRPVIAQFRLRLRNENKQTKQKLIHEYMKNTTRHCKSILQPQFSFPKSRYNYS